MKRMDLSDLGFRPREKRQRMEHIISCQSQDMRSSMVQERLTGLALLLIHYNMELDLDDIFSRKHPLRMTLADILSDATN